MPQLFLRRHPQKMLLASAILKCIKLKILLQSENTHRRCNELKIIHSIATTAANVCDITQTNQLLPDDEKRVWSYAADVGIENAARIVDWFIAMRPGKRAKLAKSNHLV